MSAARALAARGRADGLGAWDGKDTPRLRRARDELRALGAWVVLEGDGLELLERRPSPHCLVKSPGVPFDSPLVVAAAARGLPVLDELELAWRLDRRPTLGITGTNGKSTVTELTRAILERAGRRPAVAGNTFFGPPLGELAPEDGDVVVAEVSSLQLEGCPAFLPEAALVTNLRQDHLDRHVTMRAYGEAKRRMFVRGGRTPRLCVVGVDDAFGRDLADELRRAGARVVTYGAAARADYRLTGREPGPDGRTLVGAATPDAPLELHLGLPGAHNALNVLGALALADGLGVPREATLEALAVAVAPPGRMQRVDEGQPFDVLVDFAHNPDGIRAALRTGRELLDEGRDGVLRVVACALAIVVPAQRREMGRACAEGADDLVLTLDRGSPDEPADALPGGLVEGAREAGRADCEIVPDRHDAIGRVLRRARPGDVVMVLGRGSRGFLLDGSGRAVDEPDARIAAEILRDLPHSG